MKTRQQGVAIIEFALVLPLLLVLSLTAAELGRAVYRYNTTVKAVRDAVRYLSMQTPHTHEAQAASLIVYGNLTATGPLLDPSLTTANVAAPTWQVAGSNPLINTVTVTVTNYRFRPLIANMFGTRFGTFTFSDISATMRSPL